jgi:hypothetical protein
MIYFKRIHIFIFSLILSSVVPDSLFASKVDTIYFQHGDRITAEVKSLENNQLRLSTDDASTIRVEWNKVDSVKILTNMRIVLDKGEILYGKLLSAGVEGSCYIWHRTGDPLLIELIRIVSLKPVNDSFANRLDGSVSSGFSYVKASEVLQVNLNGTIEYLARKNQVILAYDGILTKDPQSGSSQRQNGNVTFRRVLPDNWFMLSQFTAESNSELQLDLRTSLGLGGGKSIVKTNFSHLYAALGLQGNRENSQGEHQVNLEGILGAGYSVFIYDDPEVSFNLTATAYPSLNDPGRVRSDVDSSLKWEVFNDFYLKWTFYYSFDSKPLSGSTEKTDWAITLVGFEYKL